MAIFKLPLCSFLCSVLFPVLCSDFGRQGLAQDSLADIIEQAEKSVVRIEVHGAQGKGIGSGFVVDHAGKIVTNCHVLAGATSATATFTDGTRCDIVGTLVIDESRDIVVASLMRTTAASIEVQPALPRKGERVTALGSPHGLAFTATTGIISAIRPAAEMASDLGRSDLAGTWIQVDAAISPGNSGGPLIDAAGRVVAMSTLASKGAAQNLNFGISGHDIAAAISKSERAPLSVFSVGIGRITMKDSSSAETNTSPVIPPQAFVDYIAAGHAQFKELSLGLKRESHRITNEIREMRRGEEFIPPQVRTQDASAVRIQMPDSRFVKWFFRSAAVKDEVINHQRERVKHLSEIKGKLDDPGDPDSMLSLLLNYGPPLDARKVGSIGFASELIVVNAFDAHGVLALLDETPFVVWMESTAGLGPGEFISGPVFVGGTATAQVGGGITTAVTALVAIRQEQLKEAISARMRSVKGVSSPDGSRTWTDRTGQFSVEAVLLGVKDEKILLKKSDGSVISVPQSVLSNADLEFLAQ